MSLPLWECGLKYNWVYHPEQGHEVTPFVGVWIEMNDPDSNGGGSTVTPFVGVWIEIEIRNKK